MFKGYRFTHPVTDQSIFTGRWSVLWAGLFGAGYVAWKGMGSRFLLAAIINIGMALACASVVVVSFYVPKKTQFLVVLGMLPTAILIQGIIMMQLLREGYRRRGWKVRDRD